MFRNFIADYWYAGVSLAEAAGEAPAYQCKAVKWFSCLIRVSPCPSGENTNPCLLGMGSVALADGM